MIINENGWGNKPKDKPKGKKHALKDTQATQSDADGSPQPKDGKEVRDTSERG